jgi:hypothetical protein
LIAAGTPSNRQCYLCRVPLAFSSLAPGERSELVILDKSPQKVEPMTIKDIKAVATVRDRATVCKAK